MADASQQDAPAARLLQSCLAARGRRFEHGLMLAETLLPARDYLGLIEALCAERPAERDALRGRPLVAQLSRLGPPASSAAPSAAPWALRELAPTAHVYSAGGAPGRKRLLVCFTGTADRPNLPIAAFLSALDPAGFDVVALKDPDRNNFRSGCRGYAPDLLALVRRIARDLDPEAYAGHVALGFSRGAGAALEYGRLAQCDRAAALGARPRADALRALAGDRPPTAFDALCVCMPRGRCRLALIHADRNQQDAAFAIMRQAQTGAARIVVRGQESHTVLQPLWLSGDLPRFLRLALEAPLPEGRAGAPATVVFGERPSVTARRIVRAAQGRLRAPPAARARGVARAPRDPGWRAAAIAGVTARRAATRPPRPPSAPERRGR